MSGGRDTRTSTQRLIEEHEAERARQVEHLRATFERKEKEILAEARRQQAENERRLRELEDRQRRQLAAGQKELAAKTEALAKELSEKLNTLRRETNARLEQQSRELQARIEAARQEMYKRIRQVFELIENKEQKEQAYAETCVSMARAAFEQMQGSESVRLFQSYHVPQMRSLYNGIQAHYKKKMWTAVSSTAVVVQTECERLLYSAIEEHRRWTEKRDMLLAQLRDIIARSRAFAEPVYEFSLGWFEGCVTALRPWAEEPFEQNEKLVEELIEHLLAETPCPMDELNLIELRLPELERNLADARRHAETEFGVYLLISDALYSICEEMAVYGRGWHATREMEVEEIANVGEATLVDADGYNTLTIRAQHSPESEGGALMILTLEGPATMEVRRQDLTRICNRLGMVLSDVDAGELSMGGIRPFTDGRKVCASFTVEAPINGIRSGVTGAVIREETLLEHEEMPEVPADESTERHREEGEVQL